LEIKKRLQIGVRKPTQSRSRQSVAAIVEASAQVLEEWGYKGATTNRIAKRAGVSVGTLYQYFRCKDEIFDALIEKESTAYLAAIERSVPRIKMPLDAAIRSLLEVGYAHHGMIVGIREVIRHTPAEFYEGRLQRVRTELHRIAVSFLEAQKPLPAGLEDIDLTADILISMCEGMTLFSRIDSTPEQLIDILAKAISRYVGT
jgi:AcrR family transcriptional regulator